MDIISLAIALSAKKGTPSKISDLTNDVGFLTNPRTTVLDETVTADTIEDTPGVIGGANAYAYVRECTETEYNTIAAAAEGSDTIHLDGKSVDLGGITTAGGKILVYNMVTAAGESWLGLDIDDNTKPAYAVVAGEDEESSTGYSMILVSTQSTVGEWKVIKEGTYLTEHQSLDNVNAVSVNGYTIVVSDSLPAVGTPDTQITFVV